MGESGAGTIKIYSCWSNTVTQYIKE